MKPHPRPSRPSEHWTRRLARRIGALTLGCVLAAGLLELMVLGFLGEQPKFPRHVVSAPWGLRYNHPGAVYRHKSADMTTWFRINSQGMRADRDFSHEKPAGVARIVTIGDSFTVGYEVDAEQTFSSVLESRLRGAGHNVEVLNAGVSGFSTAEECLYLERELLKYTPDVVIISFCSNDHKDNVRTGLFALRDGQLVGGDGSYVPAGGLGDFLNRNWLANVLSERSNAFAAMKEAATRVAKRSMNERGAALAGVAEAGDDASRRLTAAIYERLYGVCNQRGIPLVISSIAARRGRPDPKLDEAFPLDCFDINREGLAFVSTRDLLQPHMETRQVFWDRSHGHWTPFAHDLVGRELADVIMSRGLLMGPASPEPAPAPATASDGDAQDG